MSSCVNDFDSNAGDLLQHVCGERPSVTIDRRDLARWLYGVFGEDARGTPLCERRLERVDRQPPARRVTGIVERWAPRTVVGMPAVPVDVTDETARRGNQLDLLTRALEQLCQAHELDELEQARVLPDVESALIDGLVKRVWCGAHDDPAAAGSHLSGSEARTYWNLRSVLAARDALPTEPGPYVCEGDDAGPGCGLVFFRPRRPRRQRCDLCQAKPISWPDGVVVAHWAYPLAPGSRVLTLARRCADPECVDGLATWDSDQTNRPPMYCAACSAPAATTARSRRRDPKRSRASTGASTGARRP